MYFTQKTMKLAPLTGFVGYALRRAQGVVFADFNETLVECKLRPGQFAVLMMIDLNPGASQSSVSAAIGIQKANFVGLIADLVARDLVRRRKTDSDARTYMLGLTAKGRVLLQRARELQTVHERRLIEQIGVEGHQTLLRLLGCLTE